MPKYLTRVEMPNAQSNYYDKLDASAADQGFSTSLPAGPNPAISNDFYKLPRGEYYISVSKTPHEVFKMAQLATNNVVGELSGSPQILVLEVVGGRFYGLEPETK